MDIQIQRLEEAGLSSTMSLEDMVAYQKGPDEIEVLTDEAILPGYKRCGSCKRVLKLYLFNRNASSKLNCSGNCKECQSKTAQKAYEKNKGTRDYKKYYAENKERKRQHSRNYYDTHKEELQKKHAAYRNTEEGRAVMQKAHKKRRKALAKNQGIPYTKEMVVERDKVGKEFPVCILCGNLIEETSMTKIHLDHLIPIVMGGFDCFTNVGCAHDECNLRKSKTGEEVTTEQVERLISLSEEYIDANPEKFADFFENQTE